jgi:hypothetical protein
VSSPGCPRCGAPRAPGPECPHCGVVYARAERRAERPRSDPEDQAASSGALPPPVPRMPSAAATWAHGNQLAAARSELTLARFAVPAALVVGWVAGSTDLGRFVLRTLLGGMWLHELGHAVAAWLCGFPAFPGPWFTSVGEERSAFFAFAIAAGLGYAIWRGRSTEDRVLFAGAVALLAVQLFATLLLRERTAHTFITFAGDAGGLVFGTAAMAAFFVPPEHKLHRDWVRWGLVVIGAASFVDAFQGWWWARHDVDAIGFGEQSGSDLDPTKLAQAGWGADTMIHRYLGLGVLCLLALAVLQVRHVRRTRAALFALESADVSP